MEVFNIQILFINFKQFFFESVASSIVFPVFLENGATFGCDGIDDRRGHRHVLRISYLVEI